jgi:hypothetical protein
MQSDSDTDNRTNNMDISTTQSRPRDSFREPPQGTSPWVIVLAFIVVGAMLFFGYQYTADRMAEAALDRDLRETQGYVAAGKMAGVI